MLRRPRVRWPVARRLAGDLRRPAGAWAPGVLTIGNLLAGYTATLAAAERLFLFAAVAILVAALLDALDGRVARLTRSASPLGRELDSLCDAVSFAVAPSLLVFHMGLHSLARLGYAVCFLYAACGVIRLARFNALPSDDRDFIGLPIPMAAAAAAAPALITRGTPLPERLIPYQAACVALIAALMVSRIRYRSFKDVRFRAHPYRLLALYALVLAGLLAFAERMLVGLITLYLGSPALLPIGRRLARGLRRRERSPRSDAQAPPLTGG